MIRLIAIAGFALSVAVSAQAMTPAPIIPQPDGMITEVAVACGVGRTHQLSLSTAAPANRPLSHFSERYPLQSRWASVRPPPARAERQLVWRKPVGYRQRAVFACLQGDFLSKHHIACGQTAIRHKTPTRLGMSRVVNLVHVHTRTMVDAVSLSAVATDDIEVAFSIELRALLR
jgi:hypothetical protein